MGAIAACSSFLAVVAIVAWNAMRRDLEIMEHSNIQRWQFIQRQAQEFRALREEHERQRPAIPGVAYVEEPEALRGWHCGALTGGQGARSKEEAVGRWLLARKEGGE